MKYSTSRDTGNTIHLLLTMGCIVLSQSILTAQPKKVIDPGLKQALEMATVHQVEIAADLLFPILDSGKVPDAIAAEYLERLYHRAGEAKSKFPVVLAPRRSASQKSERFLADFSDGGFDASNLRVRVLLRLNKVDPHLGRKLFLTMPMETLPSDPECEQFTVAFRGMRYYRELWQLFPDLRRDLIRGIATPQDVAKFLSVVPGSGHALLVDTFIRASAVLTSANVTDRVFTTTESVLRLGARVEESIAQGTVPTELKVPFLNSYINYVDRQLRSVSCADRPVTQGEDVIVKATLARIQNLALQLNLPALDISRYNSKVSTEEPKLQVSTFESELSQLSILAKRVQDVGSTASVGQLETEARAFAKKGKESSVQGLAYEIAARQGGLLHLTNAYAVAEVSKVTVPEIFHLLRRQSNS